ncbi:hypothetical protein J6590_099275 [Homalodisca vitripennis]|nr:hypothetical protein J6590_099275 [Homalodisca vitripennis]
MRIVSTLCVDVIGQSCSYQMLLLPLSKTIFIHSVSLKPRSIEDTMGTPVEAAAVEWRTQWGLQWRLLRSSGCDVTGAERVPGKGYNAYCRGHAWVLRRSGVLCGGRPWTTYSEHCHSRAAPPRGHQYSLPPAMEPLLYLYNSVL